MDITILTIFLGVLSGVLTSGLMFIFYRLKRYSFDPWLENRLYKGVVLEGRWKGKRVVELTNKKTRDDYKHELCINLELKQSGYTVSGIFSAESFFKKNDSTNTILENYSNLYTIKGHVQDNYAVFEYCPISRKRTGLGSFMMQVKNGGKRMEGDISFVEETNMEITTLTGAVLVRADDEPKISA